MYEVEFSSCPVSRFVIDFSAANGDSFPHLSLSCFIENRSLRMNEANPLHLLSIKKKTISEHFAPDFLTYAR